MLEELRKGPAARFLRPAWRVVRRISRIPRDAWDLAREWRDPLTPARFRIFVGEGDYREVGRQFRDLMIELAGLRPTDHVLEVGCGIGRMAVPLTSYLSPAGSYTGFDIVPAGIEWCRSRVTARFPNFCFDLADVHNGMYHPEGRVAARDYQFPYDDASFDFAFATSLFTHMLTADVENYFANLRRVLRLGGTGFMTFFLLREGGLEDTVPQLDFRFPADDDERAFTIDRDAPERAVAYRERDLRALCQRHGLEVREPIHVGWWTGREGRAYHDLIVVRRIA